MRKIVETDCNLCVGCNRCVRECPIEMANITYQDDEGNIKVKIDHSKCIACGRCVLACKHNSRYFKDDTQRFFDDLAKGVSISLIAAPSVKTNLPNWKNLFAYLKKAGVKKIYDVSLGADICIWAHIRYLQQANPRTLITQPCPSIVSYCEIYRHDLLDKLSPIQSPMACTAIYMKKHERVTGRIAALSPCMAKSNEFAETKTVNYNVTFTKLLNYLEKNNIKLPAEEASFDHYESGMGSLFPMPGGLKENIEFFLGKNLRIDKAEGTDAYKKLDTLSRTPQHLMPKIFDVLNCYEGCNGGSASVPGTNIFKINSVMDDCRKAVTANREKDYFENLYKTYDKTFRLSDYMRKYRKVRNPAVSVTEKDIQKAFKLLDKNDYLKQNFDCGACGSDTCYNMARKIALKINIPLNCIVNSRDKAKGEHKLIQDTLERFETIWDNVECGIAIVDAETREIINVNPVAVRMYGDEKEKMVGRRCNDVFCPAAVSACPILDQNQVVDRSERKFVKANREIIPILKSAARIHYNGRLALLESFSDISHLKKAEEQVRLLKITEQSNRAKSDFLSRMSHEMRTPMNAIIGMTKIAEGTDDLSKLRHCLSLIGNSSEHLLGIINDILDMSKIEAGKLVLDAVPLNIESMLMKICNLFVERVEQRGIQFDFILQNNMRLNFIGDDLRLSQVITNLLSNAVKFTPDNGKIKLTVTEIQREQNYSLLRFELKDTGIGMTPEQQSRLFNAFEQADGNITRKFGGTGLGLAISKNIIEKMDGQISVKSEFGKGSVFTFEVKLEADNTVVPATTAVVPAAVRMLIADSNAETRAYFKSTADSMGIIAEEAESASAAIALTEAAQKADKQYNLVFLDSNLRDMDIIEIINKLKDKIDNDRIVILSSFLMWNAIESAVSAAGIKKFMFKPIFPSAVLGFVNELIGLADSKVDAAPVSKKSIPDFSGLSLLLAEDIEINREIITTLLEDTKIKIDIAENGLEAVRKFKQNPDKYDLILMDVQMPEMDGYGATRAIRALDFDRAKQIPIVAMTANVFKEDIDKCLESGMNGHLSKPIDLEVVIKKISDCCSAKLQ